VAGIVAAGTVPVSFISPAVADALDAGAPTSIIVFPEAGIDRAALEADLRAIDEKYGDDAWLLSWQQSVDTVAENIDRVLGLMNGLLVLAVVAAALGLINTTVMSVAERRQELGLLRAVGATRRQVLAVVSGEAALIGLLGSVLGMIAGVGAIFALAHGGKV
jgi:putative ABC transport system permease protein